MQAKKRDETKKKAIRFGSMLEDINQARGTMPLGSWVKLAVREKLARDKSAAQ